MVTAIGLLGAAIVLVTFILNQMNKLDANDVRYDFFNFLGSVLLFVYAVDGQSVPFIITNTVWGLVSLWGVIQYLMTRKR